ncbi:protein of unknown function [Acidithiobacillus ferrivorans]|uniref:Uncharacterized protein n=1 Tax=Acidithiobacillus ferrivorans TaxID=160808 RepID=A0ABY1MMB7_9PROT|nr:protein of unknown function [Acidithiobacillus ferrivorans]
MAHFPVGMHFRQKVARAYQIFGQGNVCRALTIGLRTDYGDHRFAAHFEQRLQAAATGNKFKTIAAVCRLPENNRFYETSGHDILDQGAGCAPFRDVDLRKGNLSEHRWTHGRGINLRKALHNCLRGEC